MKIVFLGVGEAFDQDQPNTSVLIITDKTNLMLDCGYLAPFQFWKYKTDPNFIDAIYISHSHADHSFGLTAFLKRWWEEKRQKPLTIICQPGFPDFLKKIAEAAYPKVLEELPFKLNFLEVKIKEGLIFGDLNFSFAKSQHKIENLAIKIENSGKSVSFSGDGMFTKETEKLFFGSDLLIHEAYLYDETRVGHASMADLIQMAERNQVKCLAFVHINRDFRKNDLPKIKNRIKSNITKIIIPESLEEYSL